MGGDVGVYSGGPSQTDTRGRAWLSNEGILKAQTLLNCLNRDASLLNSKLKVVKKTEISYNFVPIGLKMCKLALAKKLYSVLKLKTGISD